MAKKVTTILTFKEVMDVLGPWIADNRFPDIPRSDFKHVSISMIPNSDGNHLFEFELTVKDQRGS